MAGTSEWFTAQAINSTRHKAGSSRAYEVLRLRACTLRDTPLIAAGESSRDDGAEARPAGAAAVRDALPSPRSASGETTRSASQRDRSGTRHRPEDNANSGAEPPSGEASWAGIEAAVARIPIARGYRCELVRPTEVASVVAATSAWFPEISVGGASCYLREEFFRESVYFAGGPERDVLVVLLKKGRTLAGLFSCERDRHALSLYARLGVVAPRHRGAHLGHAFLHLAEVIGRTTGMGMVYGLVTLKAPHVQRACERLGWQLVGIAPGYDREMVAPGVVKRVYEAIYAKVLVAEAGLLRPSARNLTARTRAFFRMLFPGRRLKQA